jgi:hypothetical protein
MSAKPWRHLLKNLIVDLIEEEDFNRLNSDNTMKIKVTLAQNEGVNQSFCYLSTKEDIWNSEHMNFSNSFLTHDVGFKIS